MRECLNADGRRRALVSCSENDRTFSDAADAKRPQDGVAFPRGVGVAGEIGSDRGHVAAGRVRQPRSQGIRRSRLGWRAAAKRGGKNQDKRRQSLHRRSFAHAGSPGRHVSRLSLNCVVRARWGQSTRVGLTEPCADPAASTVRRWIADVTARAQANQVHPKHGNGAATVLESVNLGPGMECPAGLEPATPDMAHTASVDPRTPLRLFSNS